MQQGASTQELLPCPFCEGKGFEGGRGIGGPRNGHTWRYRIHCHDCWMDGPEKPTKAEAIAAWNARSAPVAWNTVLAVAGNGKTLTTSDVEEVIEGLETNAVEHFEDAVRLLRYMAGELATTPEPTEPAGVAADTGIIHVHAAPNTPEQAAAIQAVGEAAIKQLAARAAFPFGRAKAYPAGVAGLAEPEFDDADNLAEEYVQRINEIARDIGKRWDGGEIQIRETIFEAIRRGSALGRAFQTLRTPPLLEVAKEALPWCDMKIAFDWEPPAMDDSYGDFGGLELLSGQAWPDGWEVNEVDGRGARWVAVFRVEGVPSLADARTVEAALQAIKGAGQ